MASQRRITGRTLWAALLFAGGVASLVYGAMYHAVPVERNTLKCQTVPVDHEEYREDPFGAPFPGMPPSGPAFPDPGMGPSPGGPAFGPPPGFPGTQCPKVKVIVTQYEQKNVLKPVVEDEPEPILVFEMTRGGVVLAESGILKRTYGPTESGEEIPPPSMCPT